jgi:hypothetical protein
MRKTEVKKNESKKVGQEKKRTRKENKGLGKGD